MIGYYKVWKALAGVLEHMKHGMTSLVSVKENYYTINFEVVRLYLEKSKTFICKY
jgi:hypothetical protein